MLNSDKLGSSSGTRRWTVHHFVVEWKSGTSPTRRRFRWFVLTERCDGASEHPEDRVVAQMVAVSTLQAVASRKRGSDIGGQVPEALWFR
jgi:hypothetical protein